MRVKLLVAVMSLLLVLGLSAPASAGWETDPQGDTEGARVVAYDIVEALVETYPKDLADVDEYMNACVKMKDGGSLPGIILIDLDVDNDPDTGGNVGMPSTLKSCEGGAKIKPAVLGLDISIAIFLRDQTVVASSAWCDGCTGKCGQCFVKCSGQAGPPCNGQDLECDPSCGGTECYKTEYSCNAGEADCFLAGKACQAAGPVTCENCNELIDVCTDTCDCALARVQGEYFALAAGKGGIGLQSTLVDRGRIEMPLPKGPGEGDKACYKLPWKRIVQRAYEDLDLNAKQFNWDAAKDSATNLKWQLSTWYDPDSPSAPADDFMKVVGNCGEVTDIIPDIDTHSAQANAGCPTCLSYEYDECSGYGDQGSCETAGCYWNDDKSACQLSVCLSDANDDLKITGGDLGILKKEYGRRDCACY